LKVFILNSVSFLIIPVQSDSGLRGRGEAFYPELRFACTGYSY